MFLALLMVLFLLPLGVLAMYGVAPGWRFPHVVPEQFNSRAVEWVWSQRGPMLLSLGSSVLYSLLAALLSFVLCLWPARVLAREHFAGKALLEGLLLAPALVPPMAFSMGAHYMFIKTGLADSIAGVVLVLTVFASPYMLRALTAGFAAFGPEYEIVARNLGAGPLRSALQVELPLLAPAAMAGGSVVFLVAFSEYFLVFLVGGGAVDSYAGYLFPLLNSSDRASASILTLIFLAVPILLFFLMEITVARAYRRRGL